MQNQRAIKRIKIVVTTLAAILICLPLARQTTRAAAAQEQPRNRIEVVGVSMPFAERTGVDDGAAFAVHFMGGTHGSLEPCG